MPLEYGPLVHALSALSVGGGSFAHNVPSGSIDNAVSSFQQLLETLTQTISDLLRLLPRTTWDDSSSFDGVLRDMLRGDDFLDEGEGDPVPGATSSSTSGSAMNGAAPSTGSGKEDEVAALTLALERRARWMEVQLSKLEELHRDINTAAVKAVLAFNDNGWDRHGFMPRVGNTLKRFDSLGLVDEGGKLRPMKADELEKKFAVAKEAAVFAETEVREAMERLLAVKPVLDE
jgi:CCR4-NOT transcription complex subunit 4